MADLTVDNFIMKIKDMQPCERKHLLVEDFVKLIIQLPDMATFISICMFVSPQLTVTHLSFKNDTWDFCSNNLEV